MQYTNSQGRLVQTFGNKWSAIETDFYAQNSQPLYVLIDNEGKIMTPPKGYTPDAGEYADYLQKGLDVYESRKSGGK
jgi:thiol:disulfide interchange protein DsbD